MHRLLLPVKVGVQYQIALAWHRMNVDSATWSNIDLEIKDVDKLVILSNTLRNTEEFVRFTAAKTGDYVIEIRATTLSAATQDVAWATNADISSRTPGNAEPYGSACLGTPTRSSPRSAVFPTANTKSFGNSSSYFGVGRGNQRYQQVLLGSESPVAMQVTGYSLRQDDSRSGAQGGPQSVDVRLGYTTRGPSTLKSTFASNFDTNQAPVKVFSGTVQLPTWTGVNTAPQSFGLNVKFSRPWIHLRRPGENLLIDIQNWSVGHILQFADAVDGGGATTSSVYSFSVTAASGTLKRNAGLVIRLDSNGGPVPVEPLVASSVLPELGKVFPVQLGQARPNTPAVLVLGQSRTKWGAFVLPLSLAPLGAKDCQLLCSIDVLLPVFTDAKGTTTVPLVIPNDTTLRNAVFHAQYLVSDPGANALGLVATRGLSATIGG